MPVLLALNIVVWGIVLVYVFRVIPPLARRWNPWIALGGALAAALLSLTSYNQAARDQVRAQARRHYLAGIDEKHRGNVEEAEKQLERAISLQPGDQQAQQALQELREQKPVQPREQEKEARIETPPAGTPVQPAPSGEPVSAGQNAPGNRPASAPAQNAPPTQNAPPAQNAPPRSAGKPGEAPRPVAHVPSPFEITKYALDVELQPAAHRLGATAAIRVRSRGKPVPRLDFSLNPECRPSAVRYDGAPARFTHTNDLLTVTPSRPLQPGRDAEVVVQYARKGGPIVGKGEAVIAAKGCYFLTESRWYPSTGELDFRSPVSVRARVPRGYTVVSVGALKGKTVDAKTTLFHWETERFAAMVSLAAAKYEQQTVQVPLPPVSPGAARPAAASAAGARFASASAVGPTTLPVTCYTFPEHRDRATMFLKEAAAMVRFFQRCYGQYPYEKLAVTEIPYFPGGYGSTSFVMLIDASFAEKKVDREFLAHEIAHQWWGNSVFPQGLGAAWLTEAFANYSAWMYETSITGNPRVLRKRVARAMKEYFEESARLGDQAIYETDPYLQVGASEKIIYEKGALVLHMLRRQVGDKAFMRTLRAFADERRFGLATIEDFQRAAERESGQELGWFFDQWLGRKGGMSFRYSFDTVADTAKQNKAVLTITQPVPAYRAKMKVVLQVDNSTVTREVELSGEQQTLEIPVKGKVASVLFDPDNWYLMRPPEWVVPESKG